MIHRCFPLFTGVFTLLLAIISTGCSPQSGAYTLRAEEKHVIVGVDARPESFDPRIGTSLASFRMHQLLFNFIVNQGNEGQLEAELAKSWTRNVDALGKEVVSFILREDVLFHDGSKLTARDIVYTFETLMDEDFISRKKGAFADLERVWAETDYVVNFEFSKRQLAFLSNLPGIGILKSGTGIEGVEPVGSGPFKLVEKKGSELFRFVASENYFLGKPEIEKLDVRVVPDDTTRALEFMHGSIDMIINDTSSTDAEYLGNLEGRKLVRFPGLAYQYIGVNHRHQILKDPRVRQAIAHAINRGEIITHFLGQMAREADSPMLPVLWQGDVTFSPQIFDPEAARNLLDEAGYPDPDGEGPQQRFSVEFRCSNQRQTRELAAIFKDMLSEVGIGLNVKSSEWQTFYMDIVNGRYEMYSLRWVGIIDPSFFAAVFHSSSIPNEEPPPGKEKLGSLNRGRYSNPQVDALIEAAALEVDDAERWKLYGKLQKIIDQDLPYIDLWYADNFAVMRNDLDGLELSLNGSFAALQDLYYTTDSESP